MDVTVGKGGIIFLHERHQRFKEKSFKATLNSLYCILLNNTQAIIENLSISETLLSEKLTVVQLEAD